MNRPRALIITQYFSPDMGGASTRAANVIKGLVLHGFDVDVITTVSHYPGGNRNAFKDMRLYRTSRSSRIHVTRFWMPPFSHISNLARLLNYMFFTVVGMLGILLARKPQIVFASSPNFFCFLTGIFAKAAKRVPVAVNVDDLWPEALDDLGVTESSWLLSLIRKMRNACLRLVDHVICISKAIEEVIIANGIAKNQVTTIEVGSEIGTSCAEPAVSQRGSHNPLKVVYSGILGPAYDFRILLKLAGICSKKADPVVFLIKGVGGEVGPIRRLITESGLSNVQLLDRWLSSDEYKVFLEKADAFILPMQSNYISTTALPTKMMEYMASGRPVIVIGEGVVADLARKSGCGISITAPQLLIAAEFLHDLARNPQSIQDIGKRGRDYIEQHLSIDRIGKKFSQLFRVLIDEKN